MSNAQWPPPGNQSNSPWAHQDPNWRPQQFHDAEGRDPRAPFGQQPPAPPSYTELEPPKRPNGTLWVVLASVVVIALIIVGMQFLGTSDGPEASPSPSVQADAEPSPTRTGNYIPFEGNGNGIFEIVSYSWVSDEELHLKIRVEVNDGEYGFGIFAFNNKSRQSFDPVDPSGFTVRSGSPVERDYVFLMPKEDSTIVLSTPSGRIALNALPIPG